MMFEVGSRIALRAHNKEQEDEASWLAGCLLLPRDALFSIRRRRLSDEEAAGSTASAPQCSDFD